MKLFGKKIEEPATEIVVIPRESGDLIFKASSVLNYDDFDKLYPQPHAPVMIRPGGVTSQNVEDPNYKKALETYARAKTDWLILQSLRATDGLEWETVEYDNPATWGNYMKELRDARLNEREIAALIQAIMVANALDDSKITAARERFLTGNRAAEEKSISQKDAQSSTPSGAPVSG